MDAKTLEQIDNYVSAYKKKYEESTIEHGRKRRQEAKAFADQAVPSLANCMAAATAAKMKCKTKHEMTQTELIGMAMQSRLIQVVPRKARGSYKRAVAEREQFIARYKALVMSGEENLPTDDVISTLIGFDCRAWSRKARHEMEEYGYHFEKNRYGFHIDKSAVPTHSAKKKTNGHVHKSDELVAKFTNTMTSLFEKGLADLRKSLAS